jgi:Ca2+/Na+ antiporter
MIRDFSARYKGIVQLSSCMVHAFLVTGDVSSWHMEVMFMSHFYALFLYVFEAFPCCLQRKTVIRTDIHRNGAGPSGRAV